VKANLEHQTGLEKALMSLKWLFNEKETEKITSAIEREKFPLQLALTEQINLDNTMHVAYSSIQV
jgi:hypothetical protein